MSSAFVEYPAGGHSPGVAKEGGWGSGFVTTKGTLPSSAKEGRDTSDDRSQNKVVILLHLHGGTPKFQDRNGECPPGNPE